MKKMIALTALVAAPLAAQDFELGLNISRQMYEKRTVSIFTYEPQDKTVIAARFGYALVDIGPALFQLTAGFQPQVETDVKNTTTGLVVDKFKQGYWSAGAALNFKALFAVGVGLEYRSEKLEGTLGTMGVSTTYGRPWVRGNVGYAFPSPIVKPFIGLEVAAPLAKKDVSATGPITVDDSLKAYAPKMTIGLYGGIRF